MVSYGSAVIGGGDHVYVDGCVGEKRKKKG